MSVKKKKKKEGKVDYASIRLISKDTVSNMRSHLLLSDDDDDDVPKG